MTKLECYLGRVLLPWKLLYGHLYATPTSTCVRLASTAAVLATVECQ